MSRRTGPYSLVATLCTVLFLAALVLASGGCDWGIAAYALVGMIGLAALLGVPYFSRRAFHRANRLPAALGFASIGLLVWLIGWFVVFARSNCGL